MYKTQVMVPSLLCGLCCILATVQYGSPYRHAVGNSTVTMALSGVLVGEINHPAVYFSSLSFILGFLLVQRTRLAFERYWQARHHVASLSSSMTDIAMQGPCM